MKVLIRRRRRAMFGIAIFLVVALAFDGAARWAQPGVLAWAPEVFLQADREASGERAQDGREAESHVADLAADGVSAMLGSDVGAGSAEGGSSDVPAGFVEEVFSLEGYGDVRVGASGSVIGFSTSMVPQSAFEQIKLDMEARGWVAMVSASGTTGSFVKSEGRYTWALVTCVGVGDTTSVVVQCAMTDEKG